MPVFFEVPLAQILKRMDLLVSIAVIAIVMMIVIPLPTVLLDLFLTANITLSMIILLISMYTKESLEFSIFPSMLLVTTLFRLALNISSTRLILIYGDKFDGKVIKAFGDFVVGGNYVVGIVIFLIITVIQFIVITKGAGRVAEVAARFTLDAMPGKQMAIDADLNAGLINEDDARKRRKNLQREADFYGAMDGASKFVQGDAIAGIIITIINIVGGFIIGVFQHNLTMAQSASIFTLLTVGDGLVSQVPSLLISSATGITVTRSASEANLGQDISSQILNDARVLGISSGAVFFLGLMPGLPKIAFFTISALLGTSAYYMSKVKETQAVAAVEKQKEAEVEKQRKPENVASLLVNDPIELEIGYGLVSLVSQTEGGVLEKIHMIRRQTAIDIGLIVPPIRIRDNILLSPDSYKIKIKGNEVATYSLMLGYFLAMGGIQENSIPGIQTTEPAFGLPAIWITESQREQAEMAGYTIADPVAILTTHLQEIIKRHARDLLGRQEVQTIISTIKENNAELVNEVINPNAVTPAMFQKVLQNLLEENVSIKNMLLIIEALSECIPNEVGNIDKMTEHVRSALRNQISRQYLGQENFIPVITIDPELEEKIINSMQQSGGSIYIALDPETTQKLQKNAISLIRMATANQSNTVILVSPGIRPYFKRFIDRIAPGMPVLSMTELDPNISVQGVGTISI